MMGNFFSFFGQLVGSALTETIPLNSSKAALNKQISILEILNRPVLQIQLFECINEALSELMNLRIRDPQSILQETIDRQLVNEITTSQRVKEQLHVKNTDFTESSSCATEVRAKSTLEKLGRDFALRELEVAHERLAKAQQRVAIFEARAKSTFEAAEVAEAT